MSYKHKDSQLPSYTTYLFSFTKDTGKSVGLLVSSLKSVASVIVKNRGDGAIDKSFEAIPGKTQKEKARTGKTAKSLKKLQRMLAEEFQTEFGDELTDNLQDWIGVIVDNLVKTEFKDKEAQLANVVKDQLHAEISSRVREEQKEDFAILCNRMESLIQELIKDEVAALVVTQIGVHMASLHESEEFKKAVQSHVTPAVEGGPDKEQFEQAMRDFVQLEIRKVTESTEKMIIETLESGAFAEKVRAVMLAGASGPEGAAPALGPEEMNEAILEQVKKAFDTKKIADTIEKKLAKIRPSAGGEGGFDKEQFEQAMRAFVQLELRRVTESTRKMITEILESSAFAEKVRAVVPAGAGGPEGDPPALGSEEMNEAIFEQVKKAFDTKDINLKIWQKFLQVMSYVKLEVPKLVAAALKEHEESARSRTGRRKRR